MKEEKDVIGRNLKEEVGISSISCGTVPGRLWKVKESCEATALPEHMKLGRET